VAAFVGYSEELAHKIEAGADTFIMSVALRAVRPEPDVFARLRHAPVVRRTGGLADSVRGWDGKNLDTATGFVFDDPSAHACAPGPLGPGPLQPREEWRRLMRNGMAQDFSWERSSGVTTPSTAAPARFAGCRGDGGSAPDTSASQRTGIGFSRSRCLGVLGDGAVRGESPIPRGVEDRHPASSAVPRLSRPGLGRRVP